MTYADSLFYMVLDKNKVYYGRVIERNNCDGECAMIVKSEIVVGMACVKQCY